MSVDRITVDATLQPDGITLELEQKLAIPPGRVVVTVETTAAKGSATMLEVLDRISRGQPSNRKSITEDEMAAEIATMRDDDAEYEKRWQEIWSHTRSNPPSTDAP